MAAATHTLGSAGLQTRLSDLEPVPLLLLKTPPIADTFACPRAAVNSHLAAAKHQALLAVAAAACLWHSSPALALLLLLLLGKADISIDTYPVACALARISGAAICQEPEPFRNGCALVAPQINANAM